MKGPGRRWFLYSIAALTALSLLAGCGEDSDDPDSTNPRTGTTTTADGETATPNRTSDTARSFRRLYESGDPRACTLVTESFELASGLSCKAAVKRHQLDYAIVRLRKTGSKVGEKKATLRPIVRRDFASGEGGPRQVEGVVKMRLVDNRWRIADIRPAADAAQ